jgi:Sap-like sulfolipid-1-addressing protein
VTIAPRKFCCGQGNPRPFAEAGVLPVNGVLGTIIPLAIAVTIAPVPIMAEILLLFSKKPVPNAGAYLVGFVVGVGGVLGILVIVAGTLNLSAGSGPSKGSAAFELMLGLLLLAASVHRYRGRPKPGEELPMPKWMNGIAGFSPGKSLGVGAALGAVNPKNIAVGIAAAVTIASASLSTGQEAVAVVAYVLVGALGVAAPLVMLLVLKGKAQPILDSWKAWLGQNNATVMAVLFLVFAVILIGKGVAAL